MFISLEPCGRPNRSLQLVHNFGLHGVVFGAGIRTLWLSLVVTFSVIELLNMKLFVWSFHTVCGFFFSTNTEWSLSATDTTTKLYATWYVMMSSVCMSVWHHVALVLATFIGKQLATLQTWNKKTCPDKIKCLCSISQWNLFSSPAECFLLLSSFQCPLLFLFESKI